MTIGIIGLGYVGLTFGIYAASKGINVYGLEVNQHIKNCLKENKAHFFELNFDDLISKVNNNTFFSVNEFPKDVKFDAFIVTVGTPLIENEKVPNFQYIISALQSIKDIYDGTQLVIIRSTVSVGTTRNIVLPLLLNMCSKNEGEVLVSVCPERTIEGNAMQELSHLPQIISGNVDRALVIATNIFSKLSINVVRVESLETAELCKLYCNTFRDMTFAISNVFCMSAQEFGVDGEKVIEYANYCYPRSAIASPGFVAGPCLEKDAYLLTNNMMDGDGKKFILAARKYNESLENIVVNFVKNKIKPNSFDNIITLSGMAFKGVPDTSDLRGSTAVNIARKLYKLGYRLNLHDFVSTKEEINSLNIGTYYGDIYKACENSKLLLILNNNARYSQVLANEVFYRKDFEIFDSWGVCTNLYLDEKIKIRTLGNINL